MAGENIRENGVRDTEGRPEPGRAWVKGGEVFVKNPRGGGRKATVTACEGVLLLVNGEKAEGTVEVGEEDRVEAKPLVVEEPGSYKIRIGPGGLSAISGSKIKYQNRLRAGRQPAGHRPFFEGCPPPGAVLPFRLRRLVEGDVRPQY